MNAADQAIEEIRAVRHRISAEHGHDITKYLASLRAEEKQHVAQLKRGKELLARAVHEVSARQGPFVAVNVAGLDDNSFSDTLFTGARQRCSIGAFFASASTPSGGHSSLSSLPT